MSGLTLACSFPWKSRELSPSAIVDETLVDGRSNRIRFTVQRPSLAADPLVAQDLSYGMKDLRLPIIAAVAAVGLIKLRVLVYRISHAADRAEHYIPQRGVGRTCWSWHQEGTLLLRGGGEEAIGSSRGRGSQYPWLWRRFRLVSPRAQGPVASATDRILSRVRGRKNGVDTE